MSAASEILPWISLGGTIVVLAVSWQKLTSAVETIGVSIAELNIQSKKIPVLESQQALQAQSFGHTKEALDSITGKYAILEVRLHEDRLRVIRLENELMLLKERNTLAVELRSLKDTIAHPRKNRDTNDSEGD